MRSDLRKHPPAASAAEAARPDRSDPAAAEAGVTALYQGHALGLMRLAHIMLGDRPSAEDVVQEAFCGLYRRWAHLADTGRALQYLRTSVLNGCRSVRRRRTRPRAEPYHGQPVASAEAAVITGAERTPQSVPPLRLHDGWRRPGRPGTGSRRRWPAWLAPLAAAAAVAVVIAASLAISATFHDRARQPPGPATGQPQGAPTGRPA